MWDMMIRLFEENSQPNELMIKITLVAALHCNSSLLKDRCGLSKMKGTSQRSRLEAGLVLVFLVSNSERS